MNYSSSVLALLFLFLTLSVKAQETHFTRSSIKVGVGLGGNDGETETGLGVVYLIGYQKNFGQNEKLRVSPNLLHGEFSSAGINDVRDQFYRTTSLGINAAYDLVRYKSVSLLINTGVFINYSRGLFGNGGEISNNSSAYFKTLYVGGNIGAGFRISPPASRFTYEIKPVNIGLGNKGFVLGYAMLGLDFKLTK
ncbi:hypothetical protein [Hymenobacter antarcticus]|uniref:Outer membrane protein beta-barrel domain-containing protein n=1 Tax=Hymenobacter antarcticus TaxID=486270 RepID=A0ABP7QG69_9BACT